MPGAARKDRAGSLSVCARGCRFRALSCMMATSRTQGAFYAHQFMVHGMHTTAAARDDGAGALSVIPAQAGIQSFTGIYRDVQKTLNNLVKLQIQYVSAVNPCSRTKKTIPGGMVFFVAGMHFLMFFRNPWLSGT